MGESVFPFPAQPWQQWHRLRSTPEGCPLHDLKPELLAKVLVLLAKVPMADRDIQGTICESKLGMLPTGGTNGQFRTPCHLSNPPFARLTACCCLS